MSYGQYYVTAGPTKGETSRRIGYKHQDVTSSTDGGPTKPTYTRNGKHFSTPVFLAEGVGLQPVSSTFGYDQTPPLVRHYVANASFYETNPFWPPPPRRAPFFPTPAAKNVILAIPWHLYSTRWADLTNLYEKAQT